MSHLFVGIIALGFAVVGLMLSFFKDQPQRPAPHLFGLRRSDTIAKQGRIS
jgi:hypothetical protein